MIRKIEEYFFTNLEYNHSKLLANCLFSNGIFSNLKSAAIAPTKTSSTLKLIRKRSECGWF